MTVFERDDRIGGLLRYGIPDFKMPKDLIDRRLEQMAPRAPHFQVNADASAGRRRRLRADFDAVVLAVGALAPRELTTPGRELRGVHQAMEYLPQGNRVQAGDIAAPDIERRGQARDHHRRRRHRGRLPRHGEPPGRAVGDRAGPQPASGAAGRIWSIHVWPSAPSSRGGSPGSRRGRARSVGARGGRVRRRRDRRGAGGRRGGGRDRPGRGTARVPPRGRLAHRSCPADLVLLAAGFVGTDVPELLAALGVDRDPAQGTAIVDDQWQTSAPGVYACGDATRGAAWSCGPSPRAAPARPPSTAR